MQRKLEVENQQCWLQKFGGFMYNLKIDKSEISSQPVGIVIKEIMTKLVRVKGHTVILFYIQNIMIVGVLCRRTAKTPGVY